MTDLDADVQDAVKRGAFGLAWMAVGSDCAAAAFLFPIDMLEAAVFFVIGGLSIWLYHQHARWIALEFEGAKLAAERAALDATQEELRRQEILIEHWQRERAAFQAEVASLRARLAERG